MKKIKTGFCADSFYSQVLTIMREVTGLEWGFVQGKSKINYCICRGLNYKIARVSSSGLSSGASSVGKTRINHIITSDDNLRYQLCLNLLKHLTTQPTLGTHSTLIEKLKRETAGIVYTIHDAYIDTLPQVDATFATATMRENRWMLPKELSRDDYL